MNATPTLRQVSALCVSGRSIYKHLPGVTAFDAKSRAETFTGQTPVIAHPPCRTWSKYLRQFAKPPDRKAEQALGMWCAGQVARCGGVLEQPAGSHLWEAANLPMPNAPANPFCYTLAIEQAWFGYSSRKPTWLLIVGVPIDQLPPLPFRLVNANAPAAGGSSAARSRTMTSLAEWLCQVARRTWWRPEANGRFTTPAPKTTL